MVLKNIIRKLYVNFYSGYHANHFYLKKKPRAKFTPKKFLPDKNMGRVNNRLFKYFFFLGSSIQSPLYCIH